MQEQYIYIYRYTPQLVLFGNKELIIGQSVSAQLPTTSNDEIAIHTNPELLFKVGILMCSEVGQEMAEYTLLDSSEDIFISKYQLNIPSKERMTEFLRKENEGLNKESNINE